MVTKRKENCCKGWTKAGNPCRAAATAGGLCFFHANPNKASELGRIGGRSTRYTAAENGHPLPTLDSAIAVRDAVAQLIPDVLAGKVHPRVADSVVPLMNLQLQVIKTADLELRLARLEQRSKATEGASGEPPAAGDRDLESGGPSGKAGEAVDQAGSRSRQKTEFPTDSPVGGGQPVIGRVSDKAIRF